VPAWPAAGAATHPAVKPRDVVVHAAAHGDGIDLHKAEMGDARSDIGKAIIQVGLLSFAGVLVSTHQISDRSEIRNK